MGISQMTSAALVFLTGLLPASCHKNSPQQKGPADAGTVAAATNAPNAFDIKLGEISLTNYNDTYVLFSTGDSCTMTPKVLDAKNVLITLSFESKNEYGETKNFNVKQITTPPGQPVEVSLGNLNLSFIPKIAVAANN